MSATDAPAFQHVKHSTFEPSRSAMHPSAGESITPSFNHYFPIESMFTMFSLKDSYRQSWAEARRAPSAIDFSLAQAISGSTTGWDRAKVAKPQSVPAITRSLPTTSA